MISEFLSAQRALDHEAGLAESKDGDVLGVINVLGGAGLGCHRGSRSRKLCFSMLEVGNGLRRFEENDLTKGLTAPLQPDACMSGVHVARRNWTVGSRFIDYPASVGSAENLAAFGNVRKHRVRCSIRKEFLLVRVGSLEFLDGKVRFLF